MANNSDNWIDQALSTIHKAKWYRSVKTLESLPGAIIKIEGKQLINFASNNDLGLAGDERLIAASIFDLPTAETYLAKLLNLYSYPHRSKLLKVFPVQ